MKNDGFNIPLQKFFLESGQCCGASGLIHDHEEIITEQLVDYDIFPTPVKLLGVLTSKCSHQFLPVLALEVKSPMFGCNSPTMGDKKKMISILTFSVGG